MPSRFVTPSPADSTRCCRSLSDGTTALDDEKRVLVRRPNFITRRQQARTHRWKTRARAYACTDAFAISRRQDAQAVLPGDSTELVAFAGTGHQTGSTA
jgi:hypothetical protein